MRKKITTLYNGLAPVRARYLRDSFHKEEDLEIEYKGNVMTIGYEVMRSCAVKVVEVKDKYGRAPENMYYFHWIPDYDFAKEVTLFDKER